jgi:ATP-binding cassette subfamily B protein
MGWVFSVWNRGNAAHERIMEVLSVPPEVTEAATPKSLPPREGRSSGAISLRNVSFSYGEQNVLHDVSLEIPAGSTVAIVGRTGSGKTTLVKLLARLYDPSSGEIRFDDVPLTELALRETRSEMGFVTQDPFLFSMTIAQNIRFGVDALEYDGTLDRKAPKHSLTGEREADTETRIAEAVEIAGLEADIDGFPEGLETLVGERGITLSGGQKQRVTIARALLTDPRLLVLDDALSAVDTRTEALILDHLQTVMADRTSIIITHRFNALDRVDAIYVMDEGRVVESGTHAELIAQGGIYAEMCARQRLEQELSDE